MNKVEVMPCDMCGEEWFDDELSDEGRCATCEKPPAAAPMTVGVSFPGCSHTIRWQRSKLLPEECPDCATNVSGGTCEDYPCCGHAPGECGFRPSFTSEFWSDWTAKREAMGYDITDPDFYPEEMN